MRMAEANSSHLPVAHGVVFASRRVTEVMNGVRRRTLTVTLRGNGLFQFDRSHDRRRRQHHRPAADEDMAAANPAIVWLLFIDSADRDTATLKRGMREDARNRAPQYGPPRRRRRGARKRRRANADVLAQRLLTRDPTNDLARLTI